MKKTTILLVLLFATVYTIAQPGIELEECVYCKKNIYGPTSSALGAENTSTGQYSLASGFKNISSGIYSQSFGYLNEATNYESFAAGYSNVSQGVASIALGTGCTANGKGAFAAGMLVTANGLSSFAMGRDVGTGSNVNGSFVIGQGSSGEYPLTNTYSNSLMIGFLSTKPTFFVSTANGYDKTGRIGIGNITAPGQKLHIKADNNEDAAIMLEPTGTNYLGKILFGDEDHSISGRENSTMVFKSDSENGFLFEGGNVGIDIEQYLAVSKIKAADENGLKLHNQNNIGIIISGAGNVGIGNNANNDYRLIVDGKIASDELIIAPTLETDIVKAKTSNGLQLTDMNGNGIIVGDGGNLIHDPNLYIATSQIKAPDANGLKLTDMGGNGVFVRDGGNVGIGTLLPFVALDVQGSINFTGDLYQNSQLFKTSPWEINSNSNDIYFNGGNVGIKTTYPVTDLDIKGDIALGMTGEKFLLHSRQWNGDKFVIAPQNNGGAWEFDKSFTLFDNGNVGIGVTDLVYATAKLTVKGDIHAKEILVTLSAGGADFVFDENYDLPGLDDIEDFISANKHLPNIPSAKQMEEDGLDLGKMQIKLLQKIEELTLYIIEQQKRIDKLEYESNK